MIRVMIWVSVAFAAVFVVDRALLWVESRGWLYYRRNKPHGGGSVYHLLEMTSILDPTFNEVIEIKVQEEKQEDESGDPPTGPEAGAGSRASARVDP